jgi:two-component system, cell cycle sensor histidine kinase and response regulator CckA
MLDVSALLTVRLGNDLRALLTLMSMSLDSLKKQLALVEPASRDFIDLEEAVDGAFHIGRELVSSGRPSATERSMTNINELVAQLEPVLARVLGPQVRLRLELEAPEALVEAEAVELEWVFLNLATNSREAMPYGGDFTIRTASVDRQVGTPSQARRYIRITIGDTGHGLFGDARARAFDPFFSTREGAPGLGLTSVAMIVRSFQGWLHIDSNHSGTRIHIHLPTLSTSR